MSSSKPLIFYTAVASINCFRPSILLEELKSAYNFEYECKIISLSQNEQQEEWFKEINPNSKVPAIVDRSRNDFQVFESAAVILYLAQHYDREHKFSFEDPDFQSEALQWLFFAHGGIGPMQGQAAHFLKVAPEKIPYAINRYTEEVKRLYGVLERRLKNRDYLVGPQKGTYSIADINVFPMVNIHRLFGSDMLAECPNVKAWLDRIASRPAVQSGLNVPPK